MRLIIWIAFVALILVGSSALTGCTPAKTTDSPRYLPQFTSTIEVEKPEDWEESDDVRRFTEARITDRVSRESVDAPVTDVRVYEDTIVIDIEADNLDVYKSIEIEDIYGEQHDVIGW